MYCSGIKMFYSYFQNYKIKCLFTLPTNNLIKVKSRIQNKLISNCEIKSFIVTFRANRPNISTFGTFVKKHFFPIIFRICSRIKGTYPPILANFLSTTFYDFKVTFGYIGESPEKFMSKYTQEV